MQMNANEKKQELLSIVGNKGINIAKIKAVGPDYEKVGLLIHEESMRLGLTANDVENLFKWTFGSYVVWLLKRRLPVLTGVQQQAEPVAETRSIEPEPPKPVRRSKKKPVEEPVEQVDSNEQALEELMQEDAAAEQVISEELE